MPSIGGVYAAAVTPRRLGTQDINLAAMWDLFDFLVERHVDGIVLLGTTGEFIHFPDSERMRLMGLAVKRSRIPLLVNVSHSTLDGAVELAQAAAASGAAAVLLMPPYFFRYRPADILSFYRQFVQEADINIPLFLYNIPMFTNELSFEIAAELLREGVAQGIKDSSGSLENFEKIAELRNQHPIRYLMGSDSLLTRAHSRIDGVVSGCANAVPELLVALRKSLNSNDEALTTRLEARLDQFITNIERFPVPVGVKEALIARGIKLGPHAVPLAQDKSLEEFREWFKGWLPAVLKECKHA
jgi:4-hydroxy-tetrahydrodipicolinate synthase